MTTAEKEKYKCLLPSLTAGDEVSRINRTVDWHLYHVHCTLCDCTRCFYLHRDKPVQCLHCKLFKNTSETLSPTLFTCQTKQLNLSNWAAARLFHPGLHTILQWYANTKDDITHHDPSFFIYFQEMNCSEYFHYVQSVHHPQWYQGSFSVTATAKQTVGSTLWPAAY